MHHVALDHRGFAPKNSASIAAAQPEPAAVTASAISMILINHHRRRRSKISVSNPHERPASRFIHIEFTLKRSVFGWWPMATNSCICLHFIHHWNKFFYHRSGNCFFLSHQWSTHRQPVRFAEHPFDFRFCFALSVMIFEARKFSERWTTVTVLQNSLG